MIGSTNSIWDVNSKYEQLINYTMLYDYGDECTDITGGWNGLTVNGWYSEATKYENYLYMHASTASFTTKNKIDLTNYNTICNVVKNATNMSSTGSFTIGVGDTLYNKDGLGINYGTFTKAKAFTTLGNYIAVLDISEISTNLYYTFWVADSANKAYASVYNSFLVKQDDWQPLANLANITASSIDDILTNSTTLLSNKNAVEFMIYQCTGDFMAKAIQSETFLTALNNSQYKTIIMANEHWAKFLNMVA